MPNPIAKTPFLFLLLPLVLGIILQYYTQNIQWSVVISVIGIITVLLSLFPKFSKSYSFRWLFGLGALLFFIAIGGFSTICKQKQISHTLDDAQRTYIGYITDTPQEKPSSVACQIFLESENMSVVCYLQKDTSAQQLRVGDELMFITKLQPFKNAGNPDEFDYERYMYNQGFSATAYLSETTWLSTGIVHHSSKIQALRIREKILDFYQSLGFTTEETSLLAALTLGYQNSLSDDLKQGFRTTGTVHVLSVSGLHVGIVFVLISLLLSFIPQRSRFFKAKPVLAILLLWVYAYITGLAPSVVRAGIMLTVFCLSQIFGRKNDSLNSLYIAALFMLIYNPFQLFDIGFQLSFISVLSILVLYPKFSTMLKVKNTMCRIIWQTFVLSFVAQLATFPICLYYFGTFPTYFFLSNLVIVPLVSFIIYGMATIAIAWIGALLFPVYSYQLYYIPVQGLKLLVTLLTDFVHLFQSLPYALLEDNHISFGQLCIVSVMIMSVLYTILRSSSKAVIIGLASLSLLLGLYLIRVAHVPENDFIVYNNRYNAVEIRCIENGIPKFIDSTSLSKTRNPVLNLGDKKVLILNAELAMKQEPDLKYDVDYMIITHSTNSSLHTIGLFYNTKLVVLDSSLTSSQRRWLSKECENRGLPFFDVTKNGAFRFIF